MHPTVDQHDLLFRNMDMNEVLSEAIAFFIRHFGLIAGTVLLACLPFFAWQFLWYQQPGEWGPAQIYRSSRDLLTIADLSNAIFVKGSVNGKLVAGLLLGAYVSLVRGGALAHAVSESYLGRKVTPAQAVAAANNKLLPLIVGNGLIAVCTVLVSVAVPQMEAHEIELLIFALVVMIVLPRVLLVTQTIMIENLSGLAGLRRSIVLVSGRYWFVFTIWLITEIVLALMSLVPMFALGLVQTSLSGRSEMAANVLIPALAMLFIDPIYDVVLVFVYYQLRRRKERFSISDL